MYHIVLRTLKYTDTWLHCILLYPGNARAISTDASGSWRLTALDVDADEAVWIIRKPDAGTSYCYSVYLLYIQIILKRKIRHKVYLQLIHEIVLIIRKLEAGVSFIIFCLTPFLMGKLYHPKCASTNHYM